MAGFPIVNLNHKQKWLVEGEGIVNNLNFTALHRTQTNAGHLGTIGSFSLSLSNYFSRAHYRAQ